MVQVILKGDVIMSTAVIACLSVLALLMLGIFFPQWVHYRMFKTRGIGDFLNPDFFTTVITDKITDDCEKEGNVVLRTQCLGKNEEIPVVVYLADKYPLSLSIGIEKLGFKIFDEDRILGKIPAIDFKVDVDKWDDGIGRCINLEHCITHVSITVTPDQYKMLLAS